MIADKAARFITAYRSVLAKAAERDPTLVPFLDDLAAIDTRETEDRSGAGTTTHPALCHLDSAVAQLRCDASLAAAVREILPHLSWGGSYQDSGPGATVAQKMVWGEVAGQTGLAKTNEVRLGCFLLSPGTVYPLHSHEALEVYSVVSGAMTVVHGLDNPVSVLNEAPDHSVTPEREAHALYAGSKPVLIVYCWTGDLASPVWWWERGPEGAWTKSVPPIIRR